MSAVRTSEPDVPSYSLANLKEKSHKLQLPALFVAGSW